MKIYLCAPYTSDHPQILADRVIKINRYAANLMKQGHVVFSPISHSHYIAMQEDLPKTFEFWVQQNHSFIDWADTLFVLMLDGWEYSNGIFDEIEYANMIGKSVEYIKT